MTPSTGPPRSSTLSDEPCAYSYDLRGHVLAISYPTASSPLFASRSFDGAGRMTAVNDGLGNTTTFGDEADSDLAAQAYPNS